MSTLVAVGYDDPFKVTPDRVLEELKGTGGKILQTSLSHEQTDRLQNTLAEAA